MFKIYWSIQHIRLLLCTRPYWGAWRQNQEPVPLGAPALLERWTSQLPTVIWND